MGNYWELLLQAAAAIQTAQEKARLAVAAGKQKEADIHLDTIKEAAELVRVTAEEQGKAQKNAATNIEAKIADFRKKLQLL